MGKGNLHLVRAYLVVDAAKALGRTDAGRVNLEEKYLCVAAHAWANDAHLGGDMCLSLQSKYLVEKVLPFTAIKVEGLNASRQPSVVLQTGAWWASIYFFKKYTFPHKEPIVLMLTIT